MISQPDIMHALCRFTFLPVRHRSVFNCISYSDFYFNIW